MIIECSVFYDVEVTETANGDIEILQASDTNEDNDRVVISKRDARSLIDALIKVSEQN